MASDAVPSAIAEFRSTEPGVVVRAVAAVARQAQALHRSGRAHGAIGPAALVAAAGSATLSPPAQEGPPGLVVSAGDWRQLGAVAPELLHGEPPGPASDIWSLGATLHELLSRNALYPGLDSDHPVTAVQRVMFTRPLLDPSLRGPVVPVISRCVERDPADRWASAGDLASALEKVADQL